MKNEAFLDIILRFAYFFSPSGFFSFFHNQEDLAPITLLYQMYLNQGCAGRMPLQEPLIYFPGSKFNNRIIAQTVKDIWIFWAYFVKNPLVFSIIFVRMNFLVQIYFRTQNMKVLNSNLGNRQQATLTFSIKSYLFIVAPRSNISIFLRAVF